MSGRVISHYEFLEEIARGGMGIIYRARDTELGRDVALKVLPPELVPNDDRRKRFSFEARAAARLEHPHIAVIHEAGEEGGECFIVMELIRGESLQSVLERSNLSPSRVLELATEIAEGLRCAHRNDVLHRDLKPSNVMITEDGHVKIIDFGLAKLLEPDPGEGNEEETAVRGSTQSGVVVGTFHYMSPEQLRGRSLDARSDLFSFGICLYEMLEGERPFRGGTGADVTSSILRDPAAPLTQLSEEVSPEARAEISRILDKCLAKDPDERYQSASDLIVDLKRARRLVEPGLASSAVSAGTVLPRKRNPVVFVGIALMALVAVGLVLRTALAPPRPAVETVGGKPSVAFLGFKNLTGRSESDWLSTALSEMLRTELMIASGLRVVPGEDVARTKAELALVDSDSFARPTLERIGKNLATDYIVLGSYTSLAAGGSTRIRLDLRLQDTRAGETTAAFAEAGTEAELFELVERAGSVLRRELGASVLTADDAWSIRATVSSHPEARRLYAEGLSRLRDRDAVAARELLEGALERDPGYALAHAALSRTWSALGYDRNAAESAARAVELSSGLPREQTLSIRALSQETERNWDEAAETYKVLWTFLPESIDYGIRLASVQVEAGRSADALETVATLRRLAPPLGTDPQIDLVEAEVAETRSDYRRAVEVAADAFEKARLREARTLQAEALLARGSALRGLGDLAEAARALEESRRLFEAIGDRGSAARALNLGAIVVKDQGDIDTAEKLYRESLAIHRETGNRQWMARTMNFLSLAVLERGELRTSRVMLEEALEIDRDIRDPNQEALHQANLAWALFEEADISRAEAENEKACRLYQELQIPGGLAECFFTRGRIHLVRGAPDRARGEFDRTLEMWMEMEDRSNVAFARHELGETHWAAGEIEAARASFDEAYRIRAELKLHPWTARTLVRQSRLATATGRPEDGERLARRALGSLGFASNVSKPDPDDGLLASVALAEAHLARGRIAEARDAFENAEQRAEASERPAVRLEVTLTASRLRAANGELDAARRAIERVRQEAERRGLEALRREATRTAAALER